MKIASKGDFLDRLAKGGDLTGAKYDRVLLRLSEEWPDEALEWPNDLPRPELPSGDPSAKKPATKEAAHGR